MAPSEVTPYPAPARPSAQRPGGAGRGGTPPCRRPGAGARLGSARLGSLREQGRSSPPSLPATARGSSSSFLRRLPPSFPPSLPASLLPPSVTPRPHFPCAAPVCTFHLAPPGQPGERSGRGYAPCGERSGCRAVGSRPRAGPGCPAAGGGSRAGLALPSRLGAEGPAMCDMIDSQSAEKISRMKKLRRTLSESFSRIGEARGAARRPEESAGLRAGGAG